MELYNVDDKYLNLSKKGSSSSNGDESRPRSGAVDAFPFLKVTSSMSVREGRRSAKSAGGSGGRSFSRRCASLAKEQRGRFYIMRRCVTMLICWRDYA